MSDAQTEALLQQILWRETRSLLQYISESSPFLRGNEDETLNRLQEVVQDEAAAITDFGRYLVRKRIPLPPVGAFPSHFTTINFITVEHLLPMLIERQRETIDALTNDLASLTDSDAFNQAQKLLAIKRQNLQALEQLAAAHPEPVAK